MKTSKFLFALALGATIVACTPGEVEPAVDGQAVKEGVDEAVKTLKDYSPSKAEIDTVSYLLGVNFGSFLKGYNFGDVNYSKIIAGMKDFVTAKGDFRDPETALIFKLRGTLEPGEQLQIEFWATIENSTLLYEIAGKTTMIRNDAYLSSWDHVARTVDNPHGYSFALGVGDDGKYIFADDLATAAEDPNDPSPAIHESGVHGTDDFKDYITDDYAWIRGMTEVAVVNEKNISPKKGVRGDKDSGFHDSGLGWSSRTVLYPGESGYAKGDMGYADWRLSAANGPNTDVTQIVIGDVIPKLGDVQNRSSNWDMIFGYVSSATVSGAATTDYTIYVTRRGTTTTAQAENKLRVDMLHAREDGSSTRRKISLRLSWSLAKMWCSRRTTQ